MIGLLLRTGLRMLGLAGFLYVAFFVRLGERTLYEHASRIAGTAEARELWEDLVRAGGALVEDARRLAERQ